MKELDKINVYGISISITEGSDLNDAIATAISSNTKLSITYCNAYIVNRICNDAALLPLLNSFDIIHPDGIGIFLASKFLFGSKGLVKRFSGSDYYLFLIEQAIKFNWGIFFFGHDDITLGKIALKHPRLRITGYHSGYGFADEDVISAINESKPDILIVGLGFPKQEKWILKHLSKIDCKAVITAGDGIKVFAGTKIRGPKFVRTIGMEWFIRLLSNPFRYFKRYVIGNPLFLYRIIKLKIRKFG